MSELIDRITAVEALANDADEAVDEGVYVLTPPPSPVPHDPR
jgi:hypothetical protein